MLLPMRKARFGQFALMIAGFLAVSGSFGLHPEPEPTLSAAAFPSSAPGFTADRIAGEAQHGCLACLAHRSISLPRLAAVVLQTGSAVGSPLLRPSSLVSLLA